jgi:V8-like Glu-specific endopeptidase
MGVVRAIKNFATETVSKFYDLLGADKRVPVVDPTAKPWCAVCLIQSTFAGGEIEHGSGFLISPKMLLTAAHTLCQLDKEGKRMPARQILVRLGSAPGSKQKPALATRFVYDKRYADYLEQQWNSEQAKTNSSERQMKAVELEDPSYYDYGAILLDEELTPEPAFVFKVRGTDPDDPGWDGALTCAGYPADRNFQLCYADGAAYPDQSGRFLGSKSNLVVHRATAKEGQSGGPLYLRDDDGEFAVVGIHVRFNKGVKISGSVKRTNGAVRITKDMQTVFQQWDEENRNANSQLGNGKHDVDVDIHKFIA